MNCFCRAEISILLVSICVFREPKETSLNWRLCIVLFMSNKVSHPSTAWWGTGRSVASPMWFQIFLRESVWLHCLQCTETTIYAAFALQSVEQCGRPSNIVSVNHCQIDKTQDTFLLCKRLCFNPIQSPDAAMELVWKVIKGKLIWRRFFFGKFGAGCELWRGVHTDHHHQVWVSSKHNFALLLPKVVLPGVFPVKLGKVAAG